MRAILIDPDTRTVTEIETKGDLHALYEALTRPGSAKVDDINRVGLGRVADLWVDGEGWLKPDVPVFRLRIDNQPLAGRGVVLLHDAAGNSTAVPTGMIHVIHQLVEWTDEFSTGELEPATSHGPTVRIGDPIIKTITVHGPDKAS